MWKALTRENNIQKKRERGRRMRRKKEKENREKGNRSIMIMNEMLECSDINVTPLGIPDTLNTARSGVTLTA